MKFKKSLIFICLIVCLFSIASVCASDVNDTVVASEDQNDEVISIENSDNGEISVTEESKLSADAGTFNDLAVSIEDAGNELNLTRNYTYSESDSRYTSGILINKEIIINGNGFTINGNNQARAFNIASNNVILKNINFVNCKNNENGGAIYWEGTNGNVFNCSFVNNSATYYGGAIRWSGADGVVSNCSFVNNSAYSGSAIYSYGDGGVVSNCSFVNNSAPNGGGAIYWSGSNGVVSNCSFVNNSATNFGGAIYWYGVNGTVLNCSFVNNAAKLDYGGAIYWYRVNGTVLNCIFVNNSAPNGGAIYWDSDGGAVSGCSFVNNSANNYGGAVYFRDNGQVLVCNFVNNSAINGGAIYCLTPEVVIVDTIILKTDSDTVYNAPILPPTLSVDNCEISYYGKVIFDLRTKNSDIPVTDGNISISVFFKDNDTWIGNYSCLSGEGWIPNLPVGYYYAIFDTEYAGFEPINRTISVLPEGTFSDLNNTINSNNNTVINLIRDFYFNQDEDADLLGGIWINRPVRINGNGHVINANGKARIFNVNCSDVVFENITFVNGNAPGRSPTLGGAILMYGGSIENCNFINNTAGRGGAVYSTEDNIEVLNCNFAGNSAYQGGAVYSRENNIEVLNCNFTNNKVPESEGMGGAIYVVSGSVTNCKFTGNSAYNGGAVYFYNKGTVSNCKFTNNFVSFIGGAVYFYNKGTVSNCNFTGNSAQSGGAVYFYSGTGEVTNCNFTGNSARNKGGAVNLQNGGTVSYCNFADSSARNKGGAVYFETGGTVSYCNFTNNKVTGSEVMGGAIYVVSGSVTNCNFTGNSAYQGGAVNFEDTGTVSNCNFINNNATYGGAINNGIVINCNFTGNSAYQGGAVHLYRESTVSNCNFTNNSASDGGSVYINSRGTVSNCNFTNNSATSDGGAVYFNGMGTVSNCNFTNNSATSDGGAVYFYRGTVSNCNFTNNKVTGDESSGGAVYFYRESTVSNCNFTNNSAYYGGGAVYFYRESTVSNCNFTGNSAYYGGAILWYDVNGTAFGCSFVNNSATYGGAILWYGGNGTAFGCSFVNNSATSGGAMYASKDLNVKNCYFIYNKANSDNLSSLNNNYNLIFTFTGNENYINAIYGANVTFENVTYWNGNIVNSDRVTPNKSNREEGINITIEIYNSENELIQTVTNVTNSTGQVIYDYSSFPIGNYTYKAYHTNDKYYTYIETEGEFKVEPKVDLDLTVSVDSIYDGETAVVMITTNDSFTGNVNVTVNGTNYNYTVNVTVNAGSGSQNISGLSVGNYTVVARFNGDYKFNPAGNTTKFEVKPKVDFDLTVIVNNITVGETAVVMITTNDSFTGDVNVTVNGTNYNYTVNVTVNAGSGSQNISGLSVGNYTVTVSFAGDNKFKPDKNTVNFEVKPKADLDLTVSVDSIFVGETAVVMITTNNSFNGNVIVTVNGTNYNYTVNVTVNAGSGSQSISGLAAGNYNVTVSFAGDDKFNSTEKTTRFEVKYYDLDLTVSVDDIFTGQNATVTVTTNNAFSGDVTVTVNGRNYTVNVNAGSGSQSISGLAAGNYNVTVSFAGNDKFKPAEKTAKFEVKPASELIDIIVPQGADTPEFTIKLPSDATGTLNVTINGKTYTADLVNGSATIKVPGLADGTYNVTVSYSGDGKYPAVVKNTNVTVKNPVYKITNNKDIKMLYTAKTPYKVLVTKDGKAVGAGEVVTIKFNGKTYNVKTDKNGYATLKLPNAKPKKATYAITATYKGVTVKNKVKVNSIVKASNKKVKKSKKVTKVKVSLKKVNGKYLKGKKLKIKFNKKTYKVKTNKKGVATWKVKKSMLKKLKVGKKYKYRVTYGKDVVTKKLTIKR